jgi:hypothetical protein
VPRFAQQTGLAAKKVGADALLGKFIDAGHIQRDNPT